MYPELHTFGRRSSKLELYISWDKIEITANGNDYEISALNQITVGVSKR